VKRTSVLLNPYTIELEECAMTELAAAQPRRHARVKLSTVRGQFRCETARSPVRPSTLLVLSLSLGLATGLIELILLYVRKHFVDATAISALELNQYALWMIPVSNGREHSEQVG
jgi:hypothetical protein